MLRICNIRYEELIVFLLDAFLNSPNNVRVYAIAVFCWGTMQILDSVNALWGDDLKKTLKQLNRKVEQNHELSKLKSEIEILRKTLG